MIMWLIFLCLHLMLAEAAKYHQTDYVIKLERVETVNYNHSYLRNVSSGLVHCNRTYRAINITAILTKDLGPHIKVELQIYKFLSNEYRFFPITMEINGCKELDRDTFGIQESFQKSVNFDLHCPFKRGFYQMTYGMINFENFPPYIPAGQYKAEVKVYDDKNFLFEAHYYGKVEEIIKKWE